MKSVLEQIYFCTHSNSENIDSGEEYRNLISKHLEISKELSKTLTEEQKNYLTTFVGTTLAQKRKP